LAQASSVGSAGAVGSQSAFAGGAVGSVGVFTLAGALSVASCPLPKIEAR